MKNTVTFNKLGLITENSVYKAEFSQKEIALKKLKKFCHKKKDFCDILINSKCYERKKIPQFFNYSFSSN